jgi:hypothetical protein
MKLRLLMAICVIGLLSVANLAAADITGKWTATQEGRDGTPRVTTFTFKQAGTAVTGTVAAPGRGGETMESPITEGKVEGETVTFVVVRQGRNGEVKVNYTGKIAASEITFTVEGGGGGRGGKGGGGGGPLVAKKAS